MNVIDIFRDDAFSMISMTEALEKVYEPTSDLIKSGLFNPLPINTEHLMFDMRERHFNILPVTDRGAPMPFRTFSKGAKIAFDTFKIGESAKLRASELAYLLQFGTPDKMLAGAQKEIAVRQQALLTDIDATLEHMALSAIDGRLIDKDGTVIVDFFQAFGLTRNPTVDFALATLKDGELKEKLTQTVIRPMRRSAAGARFSMVNAWCGDAAWDKLLKNPEVRESQKNRRENGLENNSNLTQSIEFGGILWTNYVQDAEGKLKIDDDEIKFIPGGKGNTVFRDVRAPGETFDDLGTYGREIYTRVLLDEKRNEGIELEAMTYRLLLCCRPEMLGFGAAV